MSNTIVEVNTPKAKNDRTLRIDQFNHAFKLRAEELHEHILHCLELNKFYQAAIESLTDPTCGSRSQEHWYQGMIYFGILIQDLGMEHVSMVDDLQYWVMKEVSTLSV